MTSAYTQDHLTILKLMVSAGMCLIKKGCMSFIPKTEEIIFIAKKSKATVIGICETKLDGTIFDAEIYIEGCSIVRCNRDREGGGVACYIKDDNCFSTKNILSKKLKSSLWIC